jgi:uncharacterized protein (TIGR02996 family)
MLQDETFLQTIREDPREEANWLVYADWLEERGDSRATLYRRRRLTNSIGVEFVLGPRGTFWMGGGGGEFGDRQVEISREFYLGVYPVTQGQWQAIMGSNPSWFSRTGGGKDKVAMISDADLEQFPVELVEGQLVPKKVALTISTLTCLPTTSPPPRRISTVASPQARLARESIWNAPRK